MDVMCPDFSFSWVIKILIYEYLGFQEFQEFFAVSKSSFNPFIVEYKTIFNTYFLFNFQRLYQGSARKEPKNNIVL
jgi:hypothetical protein